MNPKSQRVGNSVPPHSFVNPSPSNLAAAQILPEDILPLRLKTVAQMTEVCEKTVRRWIERGLLRSFKLGGMRVVRKGDLRAFLDQQAGEPIKEQS